MPDDARQCQTMPDNARQCTVIKENVRSLKTGQNKHVYKRDLDYDRDGAHLTSFGIEFQTEEEAK